MSRTALIYNILLSLLIVNMSSAQVPTLDPEKTVNISTGQMGFTLPLGTVMGVNGHDFSINLYYKAGIQLNQAASSVGLGFSYDAGTITRKVVFVPDDCIGGADKYEVSYQHYFPDMSSYEGFSIGKAINLVLSLYAPWLSLCWNIVEMVLQGLTADTKSYTSGGHHVATYNYGAEDGKGIFNQSKSDLPDIYMVNTPYISGELIWSKGKFYFKSNSLGVSNSIIDVLYTNGTFKITLPNGTILYFAEVSKTNSRNTSRIWGYTGEDNTQCQTAVSIAHYEPYVNKWYLTKVEFNDGTDITFNYDKINYNEAVRLPLTVQSSVNATQEDSYWYRINSEGNWYCNNSPEVVPKTGQLLEDVYLREIITKNEKAEFKYSDGRKDDLWFDRKDFRIHFDCSRNGQTALSFFEFRNPENSTQLKPLNRKVLNCIEIKNNDNSIKSTISFATDYLLRPKTFYSHTMNNFCKPVTYSPEGCVLTLTSATVKDADDRHLPPVIFNYTTNNPAGWDASIIGRYRFFNFGWSAFYIEEKDYWGYYSPNPDGRTPYWEDNFNDFNRDGLEEKATKTDAWSLSKIKLPGGMEIEWQYESNRYDSANNVSVKTENTIPVAKFGGGIRVKKMIIKNGIKTLPLTRSYFYTDQTGCFTENYISERIHLIVNSSGHATVEPFPYLCTMEGDLRPKKARGGLYTPAKVIYQKVQVVDNYQMPDVNNPNGIAPNGFTKYEYYTSKDFPNYGEYGDIDNDWKRGMLKSKEHFDNKGASVTKVEYNYDVNEDKPVVTITGKPLDDIPKDWNILNKVVLKEISTKNNNLVSKKMLEYANSKQDVDAVPIASSNYLANYTQYLLYMSRNCYVAPISVYWPRVDAIMTKKYGNPDKNDILACVGFKTADEGMLGIRERCYAMLILGEDIDLSNDQQNFVWKFGIINLGIRGVGAGGYSGMYGGFEMKDIDHNGADDLIMGEIIPGANYGNDLCLINVKDVPMTVFNNQYLGAFCARSWDGTTNLNYSIKKITTLPNVSGNKELTCAGLCDVEGGFTTNGQKNDMLFVVRWTTQNETKYQIYAALNINTDGVPSGYVCSEIFSDDRVGIDDERGFTAKLVKIDNDEKQDDLIITDMNGEVLGSKSFKNISLEQNKFKFENVVSNLNLRIDGLGYDGYRSAVYPNGSQYPVHLFLTNAGSFGFYTYIVNTQSPKMFDFDGFPNRISVTGSNKTIVYENIMAYWKYPQIGLYSSDWNRDLYSICQNNTYELKGTNLYPVMSKTVKWNEIVTNNNVKRWMPVANYNCKLPMNELGVADEQIPAFDFGGSNSDKWVLNDSITRFNNNFIPMENVKPIVDKKFLTNSSINGYVNKSSIGFVKNAKFTECGVFTCDYDLNDDGSFFDKENGWRKGATGTGFNNSETVICTEAKHFGEKGLKVTNSHGAVRVFKLEKNKDYIFSAWIKPVVISGSNPQTVPVEKHNVMNVSYRRSQDNGATWPYNVYPDENATRELPSSGTLIKEQHGDWYYIELPVNASKDISVDNWNDGYQYAIAWVGCPKGNGENGNGTIYVDDIRFYPKDALVTSTYYDKTLNQPIVSIDANNKPGRRISYDGFGRPVKWEKYDLTKSFNETGYLKPVMNKEYRLMMQSDKLLYENHFEPSEEMGFVSQGMNTVNRDGSGMGPGTQRCIKIEYSDGVYPKLTIEPSKLSRNICVISGYYKSPSTQVILQLACSIPYPSPNMPLKLPVADSWTPFTYEIDLTDWIVTASELRVGAQTSGTFWLDELKILTN